VVKRISLVWKRPELTREEFAATWLGEHVAIAKQLPGLREYTVDILEPDGELPFDGLATTRFDTREAAEAAFARPDLAKGLSATRETFAQSVQVFFVEEHVVVSLRKGGEAA
jgi:uncharacterized protein (TIGR02118 family)